MGFQNSQSPNSQFVNSKFHNSQSQNSQSHNSQSQNSPIIDIGGIILDYGALNKVFLERLKG